MKPVLEWIGEASIDATEWIPALRDASHRSGRDDSELVVREE
jgi:hypothetical protein